MKARNPFPQRIRSGALLASASLLLIVAFSRCSPLSPSMAKSELEGTRRNPPLGMRLPLMPMIQVSSTLQLVDGDEYMKALARCRELSSQQRLAGFQSIELDRHHLAELKEARKTSVTIQKVPDSIEVVAIAEASLAQDVLVELPAPSLSLKRTGETTFDLTVKDPSDVAMQSIRQATLVVSERDSEPRLQSELLSADESADKSVLSH